MDRRLLQHLPSGDDKEKFKEYCLANKGLLDVFQSVLQKEYESSINLMHSSKVHEVAHVRSKLYTEIGRQKALKAAIKLFDL